MNSAGGVDPASMNGLPSTKYTFSPEDIEKYRVSGSSDSSSLAKDSNEENKDDHVDPDDIDCSICLFERMQVVLPCGHAFCEDCIKDWL